MDCPSWGLREGAERSRKRDGKPVLFSVRLRSLVFYLLNCSVEWYYILQLSWFIIFCPESNCKNYKLQKKLFCCFFFKAYIHSVINLIRCSWASLVAWSSWNIQQDSKSRGTGMPLLMYLSGLAYSRTPIRPRRSTCEKVWFSWQYWYRKTSNDFRHWGIGTRCWKWNVNIFFSLLKFASRVKYCW